MTQNQALEILKRYTTKPNLIKHALAVAAAMRHFAQMRGEDPEYWAVIGILHDIDYELYPEEHCNKCAELLKTEGLPDSVIHAVRSHGYEICCDVEPLTYMEKILGIVDQLTGFIIACALIRPEKNLDVVTLDSMKKRWANPQFAAGTKRDRIQIRCDRLGVELDYMLEQTLVALKTIANDLGM